MKPYSLETVVLIEDMKSLCEQLNKVVKEYQKRQEAFKKILRSTIRKLGRLQSTEGWTIAHCLTLLSEEVQRKPIQLSSTYG